MGYLHQIGFHAYDTGFPRENQDVQKIAKSGKETGEYLSNLTILKGGCILKRETILETVLKKDEPWQKRKKQPNR
jgi:hypothetical protein